MRVQNTEPSGELGLHATELFPQLLDLRFPAAITHVRSFGSRAQRRCRSYHRRRAVILNAVKNLLAIQLDVGRVSVPFKSLPANLVGLRLEDPFIITHDGQTERIMDLPMGGLVSPAEGFILTIGEYTFDNASIC
ncbi:MAG: hypothetical protein Q7T82_00370 [Armatimonadota bacterium]|nr:hypothetical protein [Armatimonadota bacterium]